MRAFRFRLERLLRHRRSIEDEWRNHLARLHGERERMEQTLAAQRQILARYRQEMVEVGVEGTSAAMLSAYNDFFHKTTHDISQCRQEIERQRESIQEVTTQWQSARRDRRVVESLKDRARKEWDYQFRKEELKLIDDAALRLAHPRV